ncbi:Fe-S cluster assembly protein SufD [Herpetosiphon giganteus]|uniref:Fe-S cluster assembly protein SufD n=1 Tax=Herpetosiphon giganteus TaxID=2029754 RepID=UPI00195F1A34|nr:Fe-S cluster assembly protein SufD [Herpetosiphon giganteus]MBM7843721.1 Fe-S cluster assembly protein SufD [Herpetosiphon giganteus]
MPANLQSTFDVAQFEALLASRNEPEWLTSRRREAWQAFETAEQPDWRRTNLKGFNLADYSVAEAEVSVEFAGAEGVTILPLAEAIQSHAELVQRVLGSAVQTSRDPYSALNNALVNGGIFIHVAKDVAVEELVRIRYHVANAGTIVAPRTLIVTERHSSINVIEEISSADFAASAVVLTGVEIEVGDGGQVNFSSVQTLNNNVYVLGSQQIRINRDAQAEWLNVVVGSAVQHVTLEANLSGNGSSVNWNGLLYGNGTQNLLVAPKLNHIGLNTEGQINFKTVVDDEAYAVFDGMVKIPATGQGTNSDLRENALHLSKTSRSDSIPGLEIDANEVKAGHGSTSGQIDEEQLFYLQSRGLPFAEAKRTIVLGFVGEIIDMIPDEAVRERVETIVAEKV